MDKLFLNESNKYTNEKNLGIPLQDPEGMI